MPRGPEHVVHEPVGIERQRRALMRDEPELYRYIENITAARVLEAAGDEAVTAMLPVASASWIWDLAARCRQDAGRQRAEAAAREREEGG